MPELTWLGKDAIRHHHLDVPYRPFVPTDTFEAPGTAPDSPLHRIIHGDNLEALKSLLPEFAGRVKCIYIDPPYNTGNEGWAYNDNVNDPRLQAWLKKHVPIDAKDLSRHDKWLCMMYPRLHLLHKLLAEDGIIMISIGDDELFHLGVIMDEIFDRPNQLGIFCWKSRVKPINVGDAKFKPQKVSEYVVMYAKKLKKAKFTPIYTGEARSYPKESADKRKYRLTTILKSNRGENQRETMRFEIAGYTPPSGQRWQGGKEFIQGLYDTGYLEFNDGYPSRRYYEDEEAHEHQPFYTFMNGESEITKTGTAEGGKILLNSIVGDDHGFDTVKPVELLEMLFTATTAPDSIILDSFAGSGTTLHAVAKLNARDGGRRRCLLVEVEDYADTLTAERARRVLAGYGTVPGLGGRFAFGELGSPLFDAASGLLSPLAPPTALRQYVWWQETGTQLPPPDASAPTDHPAYLGTTPDGARLYFDYDPAHPSTLDTAWLGRLTVAAPRYVVYADACEVAESWLSAHGVVYKKIPRDIGRL